MAKMNDTGLYQNKNGTWYYRIKLASDANGNPVDTTCRLDENGQPFKTKSACKKARDKRLVEFRERIKILIAIQSVLWIRKE